MKKLKIGSKYTDKSGNEFTITDIREALLHRKPVTVIDYDYKLIDGIESSGHNVTMKSFIEMLEYVPESLDE